uniref:Sulfotransferase n=1 Tax=Neolamprologus brichardi TaxID=32507 RepID=A0A3Q4GT52_NEOBR
MEQLSNRLCRYKNFNSLSTNTTAEYIASLQSFEVRDSDVFLVSYPKSGTIWAQQIITSIYELDGHVTEYFTNSQKMPWLEWVWGCAGGAYTRRPSPRLFTSHLSQVLMPPGLMDKKGKIVYLMRNPKDNMTSYYHFSKTLAGLETPQSFAQFFEWYLTGNGTCLHLHYLPNDDDQEESRVEETEIIDRLFGKKNTKGVLLTYLCLCPS